MKTAGVIKSYNQNVINCWSYESYKVFDLLAPGCGFQALAGPSQPGP